MALRLCLLAFLGCLLAAGIAQAGCVGTNAFSTCNDASGNNYTVNRFGGTTIMNGNNANTGSQWSQNSNTFGNTTTTNGQTNGQPWNMTRQSFGGTTMYNGTNSAGQSFSYTCTHYGGCR